MTTTNEPVAAASAIDLRGTPIRQPLRAIAGNTGWLMLDRVVRMLVGVTVGAWVARHLGPAQFGALAYVLAFLALFQSATSLGLDLVLARELAREPAQAHRLLGTSLRLRVAAGLAGWLIACAAMSLLRVGDVEALLLTALVAAALVLQPADLVDLWFQSQSQSRRAVLPRISSFMLVSALRVALILENAPLWTFAAAYVVESALALAFLLLSYRRHPTTLRWKGEKALARELLIHSWPLLISGLSIIVYMRIDQILLRSLAGERELGLYSAVLPFSQAWHFIPAALCVSATPLLVRLHAEDPSAFIRRMSDLFAVMAWSSVAICVLMAVAAGPIVHNLLGASYQGSEGVLAIHVLSNIPVFLGVAQARYLSIVGNTRLILIQTVIGMLSSVMLNLLLIPRYGAMGAASSSVASYLISAVLCNAVLAPKLFAMQVLSWTRNYAAKN
jgi:PST family polysaccharide transporter